MRKTSPTDDEQPASTADKQGSSSSEDVSDKVSRRIDSTSAGDGSGSTSEGDSHSDPSGVRG